MAVDMPARIHDTAHHGNLPVHTQACGREAVFNINVSRELPNQCRARAARPLNVSLRVPPFVGCMSCRSLRAWPARDSDMETSPTSNKVASYWAN